MKKHNTYINQTTPIHLISSNPLPQLSKEEESSLEATAAAQQTRAKWSGKANAELKNCKAEQVWPLWADFCNFHKWFPSLSMSKLVSGEAGKVGSVRYCIGKVDDGREAMWGKEKLLEIDDDKKVMRYELMENNIGLSGYIAEIKVCEAAEGCSVEWSFEAERVDGWEEEGLQRYVEMSLESIVKKMEEALSSVIE